MYTPLATLLAVLTLATAESGARPKAEDTAQPVPVLSSDGSGCRLQLAGERLTVHAKGFDGVPVSLEGLSPEDIRDLSADEPPEYAGLHLFCVQAPTGGPVLLAVQGTYGGTLHQGHIGRDGRVWRLDPGPGAASRAAPQPLKPLRTEQDADFAEGVWAPDGRWLYSGAKGLAYLDPKSGAVRPLTKAPKVDEDCWTGDEDTFLVDIAPSWSAGGRTVRFTRGSFCGYEGDFEGRRLQLDIAKKSVREPVPVTDVAVASDGTIWYADGWGGGEHGGGESGHDGTVFRSKDDGRTFRTVPVATPPPPAPGSENGAGEPGSDDEPPEPEPMENAAGRILVAPTDPQRIVVLEAIYSNDARGEWGGNLFTSRDGGATWGRSGPLVAGEPDDGEGALVSAIAWGGAGPDHLIAWRGDEAFETQDGTRTWTARKPAPARPDRTSGATVTAAKLGVERVHAVAKGPKGALYAATSDGLHRSRDGGATWQRIAPVPEKKKKRK